MTKSLHVKKSKILFTEIEWNQPKFASPKPRLTPKPW